MSVVKASGNEYMVQQYINLCCDYSRRTKAFCKMYDGLKNEVGNPNLMIPFTNTTTHKMIKYALNEVKGRETIIERCHTSSISALCSILDKHT